MKVDTVNELGTDEVSLNMGVASETVMKDTTGSDSGGVREKKESFEIQYVDVVVGVVDADKMPQKELSDAFHLYTCGMDIVLFLISMLSL